MLIGFSARDVALETEPSYSRYCGLRRAEESFDFWFSSAVGVFGRILSPVLYSCIFCVEEADPKSIRF